MKATALVTAGVALSVLVGCTGSHSDSSSRGRDRQGASSLGLTNAERPAPPPTTTLPGTKYVLTVKLRPGVKWSDGTALTSRDFLGQYDVLWAQQDPIWQSLTGVQAPDDQTLVFQTTTLSPNILQSLIRWNQTAARSQYGPLFDALHALHTSGVKADAPRVAAILGRLTSLKLNRTVAYGPFVADPKSVTAQQITLVKNPGGFNAAKIDLNKIIVNYGQTAQTVPLLLSNQLDYTTDVLTPTDVRAVEAARKNIELIKTPLSTGTGLWLNESRPLFAHKEFRQAVAYALDRGRNAKVSLGDAAKPIKDMAGFSDVLVPAWLDSTVLGKMNQYPHDTGKADQLLRKIGLNRGADKKWRDSAGKTVAFEITAPTDFPDFLASAKDASEQLNDFGFVTKVRGIPAANRPDTIKQGRYEAMLDFSLVSTPSHPETSLDWNMAAGFFGTNNPEATGGASKGLNWPWRQKAPDGSNVYIPDLLKAAIKGLDRNTQKPAVQTLAEIFNQQLPVIPLFERYTTDPIAHGPRVTGWLPASHPIYQNNQGSDNYVSIQLLNGIIRKMPGSDGTFRTSAPYAQPPNFSWNFYASNSLYLSFTSPAYDLSFPPLFWYSEAKKIYVPDVGASYSVYTVK